MGQSQGLMVQYGLGAGLLAYGLHCREVEQDGSLTGLAFQAFCQYELPVRCDRIAYLDLQ